MVQTPTITPGAGLPRWRRRARPGPVGPRGRRCGCCRDEAWRASLAQGRGRPAPRQRLLPMRRNTRSWRFNPS